MTQTSLSTTESSIQPRKARRASRRSGRRLGGTVAALAALAGAGCALLLAMHHPLSPWVALLAAAAVGAAAWQAPAAVVAGLIAALPVVGLMPWTGWLVAEELDLLVLAAGAGGYGRLAFDRLLRRIRPEPSSYPAGATGLKGLALGLFVVATLYSMQRGFDDAGGLTWSWWQGYHEPLNSLRVAKSVLLAAWLLPLVRRAWRVDEAGTDRALGLGFTGGLLVVSLLVVWERMANTGLLNFSTDYRTTALFWEMHVGGAALDGFLALTMPFALRELLAPASNRRWLAAAAVAVAGAYTCLVTFSRGVYLAVPLGVGLTWLLIEAQKRRGGWRLDAAHPGGRVSGLLLWVLFVLSALAMFQGSGYRGLLALLGLFVLALPMAQPLRSLPARGWLAGLALALVLAPLAMVTSSLLPKGAYIVYALVWLAGALLVAHGRLRRQAAAPVWAGAATLALFVALTAMMCMVALHWGERRALDGALLAAAGALIAAIAGAAGRVPRWPDSLRWQGGLLATMAISAVATGVFLGGAYMGDRFSTVDRDLDGRLQHWGQALSWLRDPVEYAFGRGTGRYPANHFMSGVASEQTGDYRWRPRDEGGMLVLTAGKHTQGWGEIFRISQRIGPVAGPVQVRVEVRAPTDSSLHFEICRKTLLYGGGCAAHAVPVKATAGGWREVQMTLPGKSIGRGDWYAPQLIAFSFGVVTSGTVVELDNLRVTDATGRELIANGDFEQGMARWFFTSDRHHMPWHMKNMPLHVLFEQGWVGLSLFMALVAGALWRTTLGRARDHPLAPALAGGIAGFFVVGMFDSLLDAPRVAWLFYLAVLLALALPARAGPAGR